MCCAYLHSPDDPDFAYIRAKASALDAELISVPDRGPLDWCVVPRLLKICKQEDVRIWHGHDYKSNLLGLILRKFRPMRLVSTVHGWVQHTRRTPLYYAIDRLCLPHYDAVLCVSPDLLAQCLAHGVAPDRCSLLENGIDSEQFARRRASGEAKQSLGLDPQRLLIGAVGRLSAEKGFDLLIRAMAQVTYGGFDVGLIIAGDGPEKAALNKLIVALGFTDRIRLVGYQPQTIQLYEAMDVFVLSSLREGLPNVLLEAMAMGVPVVATRVGGVPRLINSHKNGLLVGCNDVDALADAICLILNDAPLRERLAAVARQTIELRHSFALRMRKLAGLYDTLLKPKGDGTDRGASLSHFMRSLS